MGPITPIFPCVNTSYSFVCVIRYKGSINTVNTFSFELSSFVFCRSYPWQKLFTVSLFIPHTFVTFLIGHIRSIGLFRLTTFRQVTWVVFRICELRRKPKCKHSKRKQQLRHQKFTTMYTLNGLTLCFPCLDFLYRLSMVLI